MSYRGIPQQPRDAPPGSTSRRLITAEESIRRRIAQLRRSRAPPLTVKSLMAKLGPRFIQTLADYIYYGNNMTFNSPSAGTTRVEWLIRDIWAEVEDEAPEPYHGEFHERFYATYR